MVFHDAPIDGVRWIPLRKFHDDRGWLCEIFRADEIAADVLPAMAYLSVTEPGVARGPHEHRDQADYFGFIGPSDFKVYLWDTRSASPTRGARQVEIVGESRPTALLVPPGVVHAYKNIGSEPALVVNCPNRLYKGVGRREPVDEIRHEESAESVFRLD